MTGPEYLAHALGILVVILGYFHYKDVKDES